MTMLRRAATKNARSSGAQSMTTAALPSPPPLPVAQTVIVDDQCIIEYVDVDPTNKTKADDTPIATIVLVHGAPGTFRDYRHLIPMLNKNARVVGVNMPGFGESRAVEKSNYYTQLQASAATKAMIQALQTICKDDPNVFIVGHSFGGHTAIQLSKLALGDQLLPNVKGMALLASAGHRPHQTLVPRTAYMLTHIIKAEIPLISWATAHLTRWLMTTFVGFPRGQPTSYFVSGLMRQTTTNYDRVMQELGALHQLPTFHAWSKNDYHIEEDLSEALSDACGPGPRFAFQRGGHNIQKTRAPFLAEQLLKWIDNVLEGHTESYMDKTPLVVE